MKISIDSNAFPKAKRLDKWRGILSDTYVGFDCHFASEDFQSKIIGHECGDYAITRVTASQHYVDRSRTLIKRDGFEVLFFGFVASGRCVIVQDGREAIMEPGSVAFNDATRPFQTHVGEASETVWLRLPRTALATRVKDLSDLSATAFRRAKPIQQITFDFLAGMEAVLDGDVPVDAAHMLFNQAVELVAMTIGGGAPFDPRYRVASAVRDASPRLV